MSHFDSDTDAALLARQRVPVSRLFMTFLETAAMNDRYQRGRGRADRRPGQPGLLVRAWPRDARVGGLTGAGER